jgi:RimJ/RimL family protein N-acetyltransferase
MQRGRSTVRNAVMVGDRVYLRPLEVDDAKVLAGSSHYETEAFMNRGRDLYSPIAYEYQLREMYADKPPYDAVAFAVCLTEDDRCIGMVDLDGIDLVNGVAETGIWLHEAAVRGKGYGTEAKHLLLEYAFDRLNLERVVAFVFESNERSAGALKKQGYRSAGRIKYHDLKDGRFQDMLAFDLTREEWVTSRNTG